MTNTTALNYKSLVKLITKANTQDELGAVGGQINRSFEADKITVSDFDTLWELLNKLYKLVK